MAPSKDQQGTIRVVLPGGKGTEVNYAMAWRQTVFNVGKEAFTAPKEDGRASVSVDAVKLALYSLSAVSSADGIVGCDMGRLANGMGKGYRTAQRAVEAAIALGWLEKTRKGQKTGNVALSNQYQLLLPEGIGNDLKFVKGKRPAPTKKEAARSSNKSTTAKPANLRNVPAAVVAGTECLCGAPKPAGWKGCDPCIAASWAA